LARASGISLSSALPMLRGRTEARATAASENHVSEFLNECGETNRTCWSRSFPTAETFGDGLLRQSRRFPCTHDHMSECLHLVRLLDGGTSLNTSIQLQFIVPAASFWPTGPGPVFRDCWGLFGPFWACRNVLANHRKPLILLENQGLSR